MSRILTLMVVLVLTSSCSSNKIIYVASTLADCENENSEKCLQVKENNEDEWTVLNNTIEGFEHKVGFLQKIEVKINKIKNPSAEESAFNYEFVKLIYEEKKEAVMEVPISLILDNEHSGNFKINSMIGMDSLQKQPTINFKDGQISGNAGCNRYSAEYTVSQNQISFGLTLSTKMYCPNMEIEKAYFNCLSKVKTYQLLGDKLTFFDENNDELMSCTKSEE